MIRMKSLPLKVGIILVGVLLLIPYGHLKAEGAEPPELSGPDKVVEKLSGEEKKLGLELLNALELFPKSDEKPMLKKPKKHSLVKQNY